MFKGFFKTPAGIVRKFYHRSSLCTVNTAQFFSKYLPWPRFFSQKAFLFYFRDINRHSLARQGLTASFSVPYEGPFNIVARYYKHFSVRIGGKYLLTFMGRLEVAFILKNDDEQRQTSPMKLNLHIQIHVRFARNGFRNAAQFAYARYFAQFCSLIRVAEVKLHA